MSSSTRSHRGLVGDTLPIPLLRVYYGFITGLLRVHCEFIEAAQLRGAHLGELPQARPAHQHELHLRLPGKH
eukprot:3054706-Pyramimonas_sp.AAC.2